MIGNKYLQALFEYPDEDTGLNQLLEMLKFPDADFIKSLNISPDLELSTDQELVYLTKVSSLIDYYLQLQDLEVPKWLRDEKLSFERPYYHSKRISDLEKIKLQYTSPSPFKARNVYFDLEGINRV